MKKKSEFQKEKCKIFEYFSFREVECLRFKKDEARFALIQEDQE